MRKSLFLQFVLNVADKILSPKTTERGWANFFVLAMLPTIFFFLMLWAPDIMKGNADFVLCTIIASVVVGGTVSVAVFITECALAYLIKFVAEAFFSAYIVIEEDRKKRELENDIAIQNHAKTNLL